MSDNRLIPESTITRWDDTFDVVISGFGCAGASAAISAAQTGASVLVLERASGSGGTSALSGGVIYCGGGTDIQKACGFEDSIEAMRAYLMASTGPGPDAAKIGLYCEESVAHFNWLVSVGVPFKPSYWPHNCEPWTDDCLYYSGSEACHPYSEIARPAPRGHAVQMEGSCTGGGLLMRILSGAAVAAGAQVLLDANCSGLITASDGRVIGVAVRAEGNTRYIRARRGVVVATGGFIMNRELVEMHAPQAVRLGMLGNPWDDGAGMLLGSAAGGALLNMQAVSYTCPVLLPSGFIRGILLNEKGQRFINEDVNHKRIGELSVLQEDGRIFLLVDTEIFEQPQRSLPIVATGETAEELEAELGWPRYSLEATLNVYNHHAASGRDPLFHKRPEFLKPLTSPPYAVFDCSVDASGAYHSFTLGGLRTSPSGQVLSQDGTAVPGLFAAGRATSCLSAQSCGTSGLQLGEGTFFGRLAGQAAAGA